MRDGKRGDGDRHFAGVGRFKLELGEIHGGIRDGEVQGIGHGVITVVGGDIQETIDDFKPRVIVDVSGILGELQTAEPKSAVGIQGIDGNPARPGKAFAGIGAGDEGVGRILVADGGEICEVQRLMGMNWV